MTIIAVQGGGQPISRMNICQTVGEIRDNYEYDITVLSL